MIIIIILKENNSLILKLIRQLIITLISTNTIVLIYIYKINLLQNNSYG